MTDRDLPIGIFDSGVGGLTVARAVLDQLPHEPLLYLGDTAHGPYGPLPIADIRRHALAVLDDLVGQGVKLLVIACNTASAACLRDAREQPGRAGPSWHDALWSQESRDRFRQADQGRESEQDRQQSREDQGPATISLPDDTSQVVSRLAQLLRDNPTLAASWSREAQE